VLLNEKGFCKERFVLKMVPNMERWVRKTIRRLRMLYEGSE
jgi:hypothetical protein